MLRRLDIRHFAIIDELSLTLDGGLSVLTGETGAGKSIIVGALNLVLGGRASPDLVRTGCEQAEVTAIFDAVDNPETRALLAELGVDDADSELIIRRQVQAQGRSRAWINDRPVTVGALATIAERLVDISGQHQHQSLLSTENHLLLLDRFGGLDERRAEVGRYYEGLKEAKAAYERLRQAIATRQQREDFLRFQLKELEKADVKPDEEETLKSERAMLRHAEAISAGLTEALGNLEGEGTGVDACGRAVRALEQAARHLPQLREFVARLESARIELEDVAQSLAGMGARAENNPQRLEEVEERLALLQRLLRKHGPTVADLLENMERMRAELDQLAEGEQALDKLAARVDAAADTVLQAAGELSAMRKKVAGRLSKAIVGELADLGMAKTRFAVAVDVCGEESDGLAAKGVRVGPTGIDQVEFRLSPNPGEDLKPLAKIASGGELSRVMLAVKCVLLEHDPVPVSIFDEVDSGIGGAVAQKVGEKIRDLADACQVICITHLPQIAAFGDRHLLVRKYSRKERTYTEVAPLADTRSVDEELARMMSGDAAGKAAVLAARELRARSGR